MVGQVDRRAGLGAVLGGRHGERNLRRRYEAALARETLALGDEALRRHNPVIIAARIDEHEGAPRIGLRQPDEADLGRAVGDRLDLEADAAREAGANAEIGVAVEREAL